MNLTQEQEEQHYKAQICYICEGKFKKFTKVIDWEDKKYLGACHSECLKECLPNRDIKRGKLTEEEEEDYINQQKCTRCIKDLRPDRKVS